MSCCNDLTIDKVGCCCCDDGITIDWSTFNVVIQINSEVFKATGTPENIVLCHNGNVVTFKTWKEGMKEVGVTLSSTILTPIEEAYENTLTTLLGTNQKCS